MQLIGRESPMSPFPEKPARTYPPWRRPTIYPWGHPPCLLRVQPTSPGKKVPQPGPKIPRDPGDWFASPATASSSAPPPGDCQALVKMLNLQTGGPQLPHQRHPRETSMSSAAPTDPGGPPCLYITSSWANEEHARVPKSGYRSAPSTVRLGCIPPRISDFKPQAIEPPSGPGVGGPPCTYTGKKRLPFVFPLLENGPDFRDISQIFLVPVNITGA